MDKIKNVISLRAGLNLNCNVDTELQCHPAPMVAVQPLQTERPDRLPAHKDLQVALDTFGIVGMDLQIALQ